MGEFLRAVGVVTVNGLVTLLLWLVQWAFLLVLVPTAGYLMLREYQEERPADPPERRALY